MTPRYLFVPVAVVGLLLSACSKKPKPVVQQEPEAPRFEQPAPPVASGPSEDELRRQRIQARIAEVFKPIYFEYDQSTLSESGRRTLVAIGDLLKEVPEVTVRIEGHADERGTNEYNLALGERRAASIQSYLQTYGVNGGRLNIISYGEERPASDGTSEDSWRMNRRAEFTTTF